MLLLFFSYTNSAKLRINLTLEHEKNALFSCIIEGFLYNRFVLLMKQKV